MTGKQALVKMGLLPYSGEHKEKVIGRREVGPTRPSQKGIWALQRMGIMPLDDKVGPDLLASWLLTVW